MEEYVAIGKQVGQGYEFPYLSPTMAAHTHSYFWSGIGEDVPIGGPYSDLPDACEAAVNDCLAQFSEWDVVKVTSILYSVWPELRDDEDAFNAVIAITEKEWRETTYKRRAN